MSAEERWYRRLLRVLPRAFRERHGREMERLVREALDEARGRGGGLRTARVWWGAVADVARSAVALRRSRRAAEAGARTPASLLVEDVLRDGAFALRSLFRSPGFTATAVGTLALGIGANTAMFSVLHAVVLRPLPYDEPERLVRVWATKNFNTALAVLFEDEAGTLEAVTGVAAWAFTLTGEGEPEEIDAHVVGVDHFRVLGARPAVGRGFRPEERSPERSAVVVLSHGLWQRRFGGDPGVVGRSIRMDGFGHHATWEVVGVMGPDFRPVERSPDVWVPLALAPGRDVASDSTWYVSTVIARLSPDVPVARADREVRRIARSVRERFPGVVEEEEVRTAGVTPLLDDVVGEARPVLWLLFGAVGLVLLIACANLATLLLARAGRRSRDMRIRAALGAGRGRLIRQGLVESAVLGVLGGAAGIPVAAATLALLVADVEARLPRAGTAELDGTVLAFTLVLSLGSALVFGIAPALRAAGRDVRAGPGQGGRGTVGRSSRHDLGRGLVTAQVALAVVLVVGAGLVLRSFHRLVTQDPGFRFEGVTVMSVSPPFGRYASNPDRAAYFDRLLERVAAVPGIDEVSGIHLLPLTAANWGFPYLAEGHDPPEGAPLPSANFRIVTPGYFRMMSVPVVRGRAFREDDGPGDVAVGIVNERMARLLWPGGDAVGKEILLFGNQPFTVVGVVGDVRQFALDREPVPEMYVPYRQWPWGGLHLLVRSAAGPEELAPALRAAVWEVDPEVPVPWVRAYRDVLDDSVAEPRFYALLLGAFGALALGLGAVGVYGVTSHVVGARVPEFGVRIALGAGAGTVVRGALVDALIPVALGLAVGVVGALAAARLLERLLFGVEPTDPATFAVVTLVLAAVAFAAAWLPARGAGKVDPVRVLNAG